MAALSPNKIAWRYVDGAKNYVVFAQKAITDQGGVGTEKVGGQAADGTEELLPQGFKMRKVNMADAAGHKRAVVCYTNTCTLWTTAGTTLNLNYMNNSTEFTGGGVDQQREQVRPRRAYPRDSA